MDKQNKEDKGQTKNNNKDKQTKEEQGQTKK